jgi:hypothetical protein
MIERISKALAGALSAAVGAVVVAWPDGITATEWGAIAAAAVIGGLGVFSAPANAPKKGYALVPVSPVGGGPRLR